MHPCVILASIILYTQYVYTHISLPLKVRSYTTISTSNDTVQLYNCYSTDMSIPVSFSHEPDNVYHLIFDTGSATLGVVSNTCSINISDPYNCALASPTYTQQPSLGTVDAYYGIGSFSGIINIDNVSVGSMQVTDLSFAVITSNNGFFVNGDCNGNYNVPANSQGIIGFAYESLALPNTDSWLHEYVQQHNIPNVFSIVVPDSQVYIGGYKYPVSNLRNITIDQSQWYIQQQLINQFYTVSLNDILIGDTSVGITQIVYSVAQ